MSFEIYPADFSTRYEMKHAVSVIMNIYYNDIGKITLVAPINDYNIAALKNGSMLYDTERNVTFLFADIKIETDENRIIANGYTANWRLNSRCIAKSFHMTNIESGVYSLVNDNMRGLTRLVIAEAEGLTESTDVVLHGGSLFDEIQPYLEEAQLGNKMIWDADALAWTFKVYKGKDLTSGIHAVVFSDEQGSAKDLIINDDDSTLKTVAYAVGTLSDNTEFVEEVGTATGDERCEIWMSTSIYQGSDDENETADECKARVRAYATMELGKRIRRQTFSVTIDSSELGTIYNLGDLVSCVSVRFGVSFNARITGIRYLLDNRETKTEIILGDSILTAIGAMKLNG